MNVTTDQPKVIKKQRPIVGTDIPNISYQKDYGVSDATSQELTLDIVSPNIFECSIDQQCSRFIQDRLRNPIYLHEAENFIRKLINDPTLDIKFMMMDQNGNYIIQLVLQHNSKVTEECHELIYSIVIENIYQLSVHRNGCRVV